MLFYADCWELRRPSVDRLGRAEGVPSVWICQPWRHEVGAPVWSGQASKSCYVISQTSSTLGLTGRLRMVVASMKSVPWLIQELQIQHFYKADPAYGTSIAEGLGLNAKQDTPDSFHFICGLV